MSDLDTFICILQKHNNERKMCPLNQEDKNEFTFFLLQNQIVGNSLHLISILGKFYREHSSIYLKNVYNLIMR